MPRELRNLASHKLFPVRMLIRKRFEIAELREAYPVRGKWYYGLGIRLTPHGWLYCVSGLDQVEIVKVSGRKFRVGTDEPAALTAALERAIGRG